MNLKCTETLEQHEITAVELTIGNEQGTETTQEWFWESGPFICECWKEEPACVIFDKLTEDPSADFNTYISTVYDLSEFFEVLE